MEPSLLHQLGIALGLGLLVGLERQWSATEVAGIRTFGLITVLGTLCGALAKTAGGWTIAAGFAGVTALFVIGNVVRMRKGNVDAGLTTEVAGLVMFGVGALLTLDQVAPAIVTGGGVAVLLYGKRRLHDIAKRIDEDELRAIFRLVLVALVILPALPNKAYGPYAVLNPFHIWLMVALIVGISLAAYLGYRLLGPRAGTLAAGVFGGLISSTATSASCARQSRQGGVPTGAAIVVMLASTVVFVRVLVEIAIAAPSAFARLAPPIVVMLVLLALIAAAALARSHRSLSAAGMPNPSSDMRAAIGFGLLYALVLLAVAAAEQHLGPGGVYAAAALSGLTDMDAITLSTARLVVEERLPAEVGWRAILVAAMANLVFKAAIVAALGTRAMAVRVAAGFAIGIAGGVVLLIFWR
jgi:uncharacterized membrane protein (DUF4010 family)